MPLPPFDLPADAFQPREVLDAIAAQIPALTHGALRGKVWGTDLFEIVSTFDFYAIVEEPGPGFGLFQVDHAFGKPYPVYVSAPCFGEVWPPPPLGPSDPSYKVAPSANNPREFLDLIEQVFASEYGQKLLASLLSEPQAQANAARFASRQPPALAVS